MGIRIGRTPKQSPEEFKANLHAGQNLANQRKAQAPTDIAAARARRNGGQS